MRDLVGAILTSAGSGGDGVDSLSVTGLHVHTRVCSTRNSWYVSCTRVHSRFCHSTSSYSTSACHREQQSDHQRNHLTASGHKDQMLNTYSRRNTTKTRLEDCHNRHFQVNEQKHTHIQTISTTTGKQFEGSERRGDKNGDHRQFRQPFNL